eukprot:5166984-Pyramimonas_sp.AAC.1
MAAARAQRAAARSPKGCAAAACAGWGGITLMTSADAAPTPAPASGADAAASDAFPRPTPSGPPCGASGPGLVAAVALVLAGAR